MMYSLQFLFLFWIHLVRAPRIAKCWRSFNELQEPGTSKLPQQFAILGARPVARVFAWGGQKNCNGGTQRLFFPYVFLLWVSVGEAQVSGGGPVPPCPHAGYGPGYNGLQNQENVFIVSHIISEGRTISTVSGKILKDSGYLRICLFYSIRVTGEDGGLNAIC